MTRFMVQWADHPSHLATRLGQLLEHQTLVDVTLMCNTHTLRVHRAVLAAGSPYFETILQRQLGQHPLIVLKDMQFTVLKCLIEFMYCGETSVTEENLPALLQAAKFFQVRGLSAMTKEALGLKSGPSDATVNGAGDPGAAVPVVQTPQIQASVPRPGTKRLNVEGKPTPTRQQRAVLKPRSVITDIQAGSPKPRQAGPGGDTPRMTFHTIPKTVPTRPLASRSMETQADNARLLLSLSGSESFQAKTTTPTPPTTVLGRPRQVQTPLQGAKNAQKTTTVGANKNIRFHHNVSGIIPPISSKLTLHEGVNRVVTPPKRRGRPPARANIPKTLTPALKLALENQAKNKAISPKAPVPEPAVPMEFVPVDKEEAAAAGVQTEKTATLYRDPTTNILYQVEDSTPAETETIIYQLPDGTITDKDGNAIVDEDGNTQNINNLQMERAGGEVVYQMEAAAGDEEGNLVYQMEGTVEGTEEDVVEAVEGGGETYMNSQYMDVLKRAGLPTDMPILLDSGDGRYVAVNEEVLRNIVDGGVLQVTEGNLVQEEGEEFLMPEEQPTETQEQTEETAQHEQVQELEHNEEGSTTIEQQEKHEEVMTIVGKSLPSLDDEGEEEEVITGDPYGELNFQESSGHNFPSHEEGTVITESSAEQTDFIYEQKEPEEVEMKPSISVEQALEEMMGEATDTTEEKEVENEQSNELQSDQQAELDNLQNVLNSSMESNTTNGAFQTEVNSVMLPGDDSSVTNQTEDSLINETELEDCHLKSSSLLLKNALRESGIVAEGDLEENMERDDSMDKLNAASAEENSMESLDEMPSGEQTMKEMVYEITNEVGEKRRITISGEAIVLPDEQSLADVNPAARNILTEEGKVGVSPSKDIPFAVGLLPLQTALEKIQSMPDYQPRKTRSSDEPVTKSKRKASTNAEGTEKRPKLDEMETEEGDTEAIEEKGNDMEALIPELVEANDN